MNKYYKYIIIIEIIILTVLIFIGRKQDKENEETSGQDIQVEELPSIFTILPYEEESIAIYYYEASYTFEIEINSYPYKRNLEYALSILHDYKETKDFTEDDVRIVTPSFMYSE